MELPILEIEGLGYSVKDREILTDINFSLAANDYVGIIGPNGGGKTTLLKLILGLLTPSSGVIRILGQQPYNARGLVGYVPQFSKFESDYPVSCFDIVLMGRLHQRKWFRRYNNKDREVAKDCLARVKMIDFSNRHIGRLSGGQLQRVLIARALAQEPRILLLDEPTASVDTPFGEELYQILADLNKKMAIVLVSHDIGVLAREVRTIGCLNQKLYYHNSRDITAETLKQVYGCPVDLIAHGHAHRVLEQHHQHQEKE